MGKKITTFLVMLSIVLGTIYIVPDIQALAWTDCTTTNTYSSHDFSSGCPGQTVTCSHTGKKGSCTVTGKGTGSHSYDSWQYTSNNDGTHYKYRYCKNNGCNHLNVNSGNESCNTSGSNGSCSKCGYGGSTTPTTPPSPTGSGSCSHTYTWSFSSTSVDTDNKYSSSAPTVYYVCSKCFNVSSSHTFSASWGNHTSAGNCNGTDNGLKWRPNAVDANNDGYCDRCGKSMSGSSTTPDPTGSGGCSHKWKDYDHTCKSIGYKECTKCGERVQYTSFGDHQWLDADCEHPQTCSVCALHQGDALGHDFKYTDNKDGNTHTAECQRNTPVKCGKVNNSEGHIDTNPKDKKCDLCGGDVVKKSCDWNTCGCKGTGCPADQAKSCSAQCYGSMKSSGTFPDPVFNIATNTIKDLSTTAIVSCVSWDGCGGHTLYNYHIEGTPTTSMNGCNWSYSVTVKADCQTCSGHSYNVSASGTHHVYRDDVYTVNGVEYLYTPTENNGKHKKRSRCTFCGKYEDTSVQSHEGWWAIDTNSYSAWTKDTSVSPNPKDNGNGTREIYEIRTFNRICGGCGLVKAGSETRHYTEGKPTPVITPPPTPEITPEITPTPTGTVVTPPPTGTVITGTPTDPPTYKTIKLKDNNASTHLYYYTDNSNSATQAHDFEEIDRYVQEIPNNDTYHAVYINQRCKTVLNNSGATLVTILGLNGYTNYSTCGHTNLGVLVSNTVPHTYPSSWENYGDATYHRKICSTDGCGHVYRTTHNFGGWTDDGNNTTHSRKCSDCGYVETKNHEGNYGGWYDLDNTNHGRTCSVCNYVQKEEHTAYYGAWQNVTTDHTYHYRYCSRCNHKGSQIHAYPATYTRVNGNLHQRVCTISTCQHVYQEIHTYSSYSYGGVGGYEYKPTADNTKHEKICTANGCGNTVTNPHTWGNWLDRNVSNSTAHYRKCSGCGLEQDEPHKYPANWEDYGNATNHRKICTVNTCKHTITENHSYVRNTNQPWIDTAPTSNSESGIHERYCNECNRRVYDNHSYNEVSTDKPGFHKYQCTAIGCGHIYYVAYKYSVIFNPNSGTVNGGTANYTYTYTMGDGEVSFPDCSRTDYVFKGWQKYSGYTDGNVTDTDPLTNGNTTYYTKNNKFSFDGSYADKSSFTYIAIWEHKKPVLTENTQISAKSTVFTASKMPTGRRGYYVKGKAGGQDVYLDGTFVYNSAPWVTYKYIKLNVVGIASNANIQPTDVNGQTIAKDNGNSNDVVLPTKKITAVASGKSYPYWVHFTDKNGTITIYQSSMVVDNWKDSKVTKNETINKNSTDYVTIMSDGNIPTLNIGDVSALSQLNWKDIGSKPVTLVATELNETDSGLSAESYVKITNLTNGKTRTLTKTPTTDAYNRVTTYTFETFDALDKNSLQQGLFDGEWKVDFHIIDNVGNVYDGTVENLISVSVDTLRDISGKIDYPGDTVTLKKGGAGSFWVHTTGNVERLEIIYPNGWKIKTSNILVVYHGNIEDVEDMKTLTKLTTNVHNHELTTYTKGNTNDRFCFVIPLTTPKGIDTVTVNAYRGSAVKTATFKVNVLNEAVTDGIYSYIKNQK